MLLLVLVIVFLSFFLKPVVLWLASFYRRRCTVLLTDALVPTDAVAALSALAAVPAMRQTAVVSFLATIFGVEAAATGPLCGSFFSFSSSG